MKPWPHLILMHFLHKQNCITLCKKDIRNVEDLLGPIYIFMNYNIESFPPLKGLKTKKLNAVRYIFTF